MHKQVVFSDKSLAPRPKQRVPISWTGEARQTSSRHTQMNTPFNINRHVIRYDAEQWNNAIDHDVSSQKNAIAADEPTYGQQQHWCHA